MNKIAEWVFSRMILDAFGDEGLGLRLQYLKLDFEKLGHIDR